MLYKNWTKHSNSTAITLKNKYTINRSDKCLLRYANLSNNDTITTNSKQPNNNCRKKNASHSSMCVLNRIYTHFFLSFHCSDIYLHSGTWKDMVSEYINHLTFIFFVDSNLIEFNISYISIYWWRTYEFILTCEWLMQQWPNEWFFLSNVNVLLLLLLFSFTFCECVWLQ